MNAVRNERCGRENPLTKPRNSVGNREIAGSAANPGPTHVWTLAELMPALLARYGLVETDADVEPLRGASERIKEPLAGGAGTCKGRES